MKNWRTIILIAVTMIVIAIIKFGFGFPSADIEIIGVILSISSILFGLLVGFFISELWTRYTEIRSLQGDRSASGMNLVRRAEYFYLKNPKFEKEFKKRMEMSAIADESILWDEGQFEEPYYNDVAKTFELVDINQKKDELYFEYMMISHNTYTQSTIKMNTLYRERLFFTEWLILIALSIVIFLSTLFLDTSHFLYKTIVLTFPPIIVIALSIIYDLDKMKWGRELITLEPTQVILDAIGAKRFYLKKDKAFISPHITEYRTEDDLEGYSKQVYDEILALRAQKNKKMR